MEQIHKPQLEQFQIYKDGEVSRAHEIRRYATYSMKMIGYIAYRGLETTVNVVDELVQSVA